MAFAFVDLETTGLDENVHEAWEIAWAFDDEPVRSIFLAHDGRERTPQADEVNHYLERCPTWARQRPREYRFDSELELAHRFQQERPFIVASAPSAVDIPFLSKRWPDKPWQYRTIDISTYAMPILKHREPVGLWRLSHELHDMGHTVVFPDHTAAADVESLRSCWRALNQLVDFGGAA